MKTDTNMGSPRPWSKMPDMNQRSSHQQTVPVEEDVNPFGDQSHYRDLPPSYAEASSSSAAPNTARDTTTTSPSTTTSTSGCRRGYTPQKSMSVYNGEAKWEAMRNEPGCCFSDGGGCCFSSRGGCCFSDRGGCCFSDREGCCFSDRKGCCFSDNGGCCF